MEQHYSDSRRPKTETNNTSTKCGSTSSSESTSKYCILCCSNCPQSILKASLSVSIKVASSLVKLLELEEESESYINLFLSANYCSRCKDLLNHIHSLSTLLESERNYINRLLVRNYYGNDLKNPSEENPAELENYSQSQSRPEVTRISISSPLSRSAQDQQHGDRNYSSINYNLEKSEPEDTSNHILKCLENLIPAVSAPMPIPEPQSETFESQEEQIIIQPKIEFFDDQMEEHDDEDCCTNSTGDGLDFIGPDDESIMNDFPQHVNVPCPTGTGILVSPVSFSTPSKSNLTVTQVTPSLSPSGWVKAIKSNTRTSFQSVPSRSPRRPVKPAQALKNFECRICGSRFARGSFLRAHMSLHAGGTGDTKPSYTCTFCIAPHVPCYKDPWSLRNHLIKKHNDRMSQYSHLVKCDVENCRETFSSKISYSRHMKIHDPSIKPENICRICKIGFTRADRMVQHKLKYHRNR